MTCPVCKILLNPSADVCPFCGRAFTRRGRRAVLYNPRAKKTVLTFAGQAQRALYFLAFAAFFASSGLAALSPSGGTLQTASVPTVSAAPSVSPAPTPTPVPETVFPSDPGGPFSGRSGEYGVEFYLSEGSSENADTQAAMDALLNETFEGYLTLDVNAAGAGTVVIEQSFFSPDEIPVSAFVDSGENVSTTTLYGIADSYGVKVTVVCVFEDDTLSGFIWMDDGRTHMEFLYSE